MQLERCAVALDCGPGRGRRGRFPTLERFQASCQQPWGVMVISPPPDLTSGSDSLAGDPWLSSVTSISLAPESSVTPTSFIHSFNKEWLSIYSVPSTRDTVENLANKDPANVKLIF